MYNVELRIKTLTPNGVLRADVSVELNSFKLAVNKWDSDGIGTVLRKRCFGTVSSNGIFEIRSCASTVLIIFIYKIEKVQYHSSEKDVYTATKLIIIIDA